MLTLILLSVWLVLSFSVTGFFLWLGARWAGIPHITFRRSLVTVGIICGIGLLAQIGFAVLVSLIYFLSPPGKSLHRLDLVVFLASLCIGILVSWLVIVWRFRTTFGKAVRAWLVALIALGLNVAVAFFVIKPFVLEFLVTPTNAMAPTLVGYHQYAPCPYCGA